MNQTVKTPKSPPSGEQVQKFWSSLRRGLSQAVSFCFSWVPKGLFGRTLLILLVPIIMLQAVVAFVFMDRHWELVTKRLSEGIARDFAVIANLIEQQPTIEDKRALLESIQSDFEFSLSLLPKEPLPEPGPRPFFAPLDRFLSDGIRSRVKKPFWIDTLGDSRFVETRILMDDSTLRIITRRSHTYASNSHIFIVWMVSTSILLIIVSILFLRSQTRPIQKLAAAAEAFGKGRQVKGFRPAGATEVRMASAAFIEMRHRIERQIDQRTAMLAGVSHDLRTILTRFQLQIALLDQNNPEVGSFKKDIDEMNRILEAYLTFAKEDEPEEAEEVDIQLLFEELEAEIESDELETTCMFEGEAMSIVKPIAYKRCLSNLLTNACRYASKIEIVGEHRNGWLTVWIHDNGPGIPKEELENVFRPFYRLDSARNQDEGNTGLGLAIARDIARGHGGNITLSESPLGGMMAKVRIPA